MPIYGRHPCGVVAGADVDVQDPEGYTPLHMAAGYLHVEAVEELLKAGADITRSDRSGRDVRTLVDNLRERMGSANSIQQRMRLEKMLRFVSLHPRPPVALPLLLLFCTGYPRGILQQLETLYHLHVSVGCEGVDCWRCRLSLIHI